MLLSLAIAPPTISGRIQLDAYLHDEHDRRELFDALRRRSVDARQLPFLTERLLTEPLLQRDLESLYLGASACEDEEARIAAALRDRFPNSLIGQIHFAAKHDAPPGVLDRALRLIEASQDFSELLELALLRPSHRALSFAIGRRMIALRPDSVLARISMLFTMRLLAEPMDGPEIAAEARALYQELVRLQPDTLDGRIHLIAVLQPVRDRDEILALGREVLALDPAHPEALSSSAITLCITDGEDAARLFLANHETSLQSAGFAAVDRTAIMQPAYRAVTLHADSDLARTRGWPSLWP